VLFLVATPIGNLSDITFRAIEVLKSCDYILCEDTRHSIILLRHYEILKPLKSFHKFSESAKEAGIIEDLIAGKNIALISDAGTPGIADPGTQLVQECIQQNIPVTSIPGPCAAITALSCSGLATDRFQFFGFLPRKSNELKRSLQEILAYSGTTVCYEAPHRLIETLQALQELAPDRKLVIGRELTKKFEEFKRGTAQELLAHWNERSIKGECVLLIDGAPAASSVQWENLSPQEHVVFLQETYKISQQEAIKLAAEMRNVRKRDIYNAIVKTKNDTNSPTDEL
jgi:16S rRNA (cytidine1402-2'-O)-methyltransferase